MSAPLSSGWVAVLADRVFQLSAPLVVLSLVMIYVTRDWDPLTAPVPMDPAGLAWTAPDPAPAGTSAAAPSPAADPERIRRGLLLDTDVALVYREVDGRLEAHAITRSRDARVWLEPTADACASRITAFCRLLVEPGFGRPAVDEARALHGLLVQPALAAVGNPRVERLLVVPAGPIARLPFAALAAGDDWTWLGFFVVTTACPDAAKLEARATAAVSARAARVFAVSGPDDAATRAARHIAAHGGAGSAVFLDPGGGEGSATSPGPSGESESLTDAIRAHRPDLLYFASGAGRPALAGLDLENTVVIAPAAAPSRFVDPLAASRAFLDAGAAAVLAPRWPIAPRVRRKFITRFCHHLADGVEPGKALAETRRDFSRSPGIGGPSTWAAFALVGNDRQSVSLHVPFRWFSFWWTVALVATLVAGFRLVSVLARHMEAKKGALPG